MLKSLLENVIFVDDQDEIHAIAKMAFKKYTNINFVLLKNPEFVLTEISKVNPQLVIMDWQMPEMSGADLLRQIRKNYSNQQLKVFVLTGETRSGEIETIKNLGVDLVLEKGNGLRTLFSQIQELYLNLTG